MLNGKRLKFVQYDKNSYFLLTVIVVSKDIIVRSVPSQMLSIRKKQLETTLREVPPIIRNGSALIMRIRVFGF